MAAVQCTEKRLTIHQLSKVSTFDLRSRIAKFRKLELTRFSQEQVGNRIGRILDGYTTKLIPLILSGVVRARKNSGGGIFNTTAQLWYPPAAKVKKSSRLNAAGESLFYASNRMNAAIYELHPMVGDVFTVMIARPKLRAARLNVAQVGLERLSSPDLHNLSKSALPREDQQLQKALGSPNNFKKWLMIDDFLGDLFTAHVGDAEEHKYKPTIAIGSNLFGIPGIDGINYPSVATNLNAINLCLKPEKADEIFEPSEFFMVKLSDQKDASELGVKTENGTMYRIDFIRESRGINRNGEIEWGPEVLNLPYERVEHLMKRVIIS